ncbi:MAG TPA: hypothetical protein VKQ29_15045 [Aliidongia sp.]|nr:hypothetical protein [Aliidongia sp.]
MSISTVGSSAAAAPASPLTGNAALKAARAQYLRTGIDKDAAAGDPDHDAPRKVISGAAPTAAPATQTSSSSATIANATATIATSSAAAAATYSANAKR